MASIHQRPGSKYFHAAFRDASGRLILRSTKCTERKKALEAALAFERTARRAESLTEEQARKVVSDLMERVGNDPVRNPATDEFLREWLKDKKAAKSERTAEKYDSTVEKFLTFLGSRAQRAISAISARDIQSYITERMKEGISASTASLDAEILRIAFNRAARQGIINNNPVHQVELPERGAVERGTFTAEEVRMLVDAAEGEWKTLIRLAYYTGARMGDCVNLEWNQVDFAQGTISFRAQKTGKNIELPLHPELQAHLEGIAGSDKPERFILPGLAGLGSGGRRGLSETFKQIARRAGLDLQEVQGGGTRKINKRTFHALRHSLVSGLANAGVAPELRMKITGHKSAEIHRGYTHHERKTLHEAMAKLPGIGAAKK